MGHTRELEGWYVRGLSFYYAHSEDSRSQAYSVYGFRQLDYSQECDVKNAGTHDFRDLEVDVSLSYIA